MTGRGISSSVWTAFRMERTRGYLALGVRRAIEECLDRVVGIIVWYDERNTANGERFSCSEEESGKYRERRKEERINNLEKYVHEGSTEDWVKNGFIGSWNWWLFRGRVFESVVIDFIHLELHLLKRTNLSTTKHSYKHFISRVESKLLFFNFCDRFFFLFFFFFLFTTICFVFISTSRYTVFRQYNFSWIGETVSD